MALRTGSACLWRTRQIPVRQQWPRSSGDRAWRSGRQGQRFKSSRGHPATLRERRQTSPYPDRSVASVNSWHVSHKWEYKQMPWTSKEQRNEGQRQYRREVLGMQPRPAATKYACQRPGCENLSPRAGQHDCSAACHDQHQSDLFIAAWLAGEIAPSDYLGRVSKQIKRWLIEQYGEKCQQCGWAERNSVPGKVPLTFDHKDGDCTNKARENLRLLCPNCHALTPTYASLSFGRSRRKRKWAGTAVVVKRDSTGA